MKSLFNLVIIAIILLGCGVFVYMDPDLRSKVRDVFSDAGPEAQKPESPPPPPVSVAEVVENFLTPGIRHFTQSGGTSGDTYRAAASQLEHARREGRKSENETQLVELAVRKMEEIKAISEAYVAANQLLPPAGLKTSDVGFSHATLLWDVLPVPAISYEVWDGPPSDASSRKLTATREVPCRIENGLRPDTEYVFYVRATYAGNYSETSSISVTTKPVSLGPPANLRVMEVGEDSIMLGWDAFSLPRASYEIWDKAPSDSTPPLRTLQDTAAHMKGLQPDTEYVYYIRTIWEDKMSKAASIRAKTKSLSPPGGVVVAEAGLDFVTLKWNASPVPDVYYEVSLAGPAAKNKETTRDTTVRFEKLESGTEYILNIRVVHKNNAASESVSVKVKTKTYHDIAVGKWTYRWPGADSDITIVLGPDGTFKAELDQMVATGNWTIQDDVLTIKGTTSQIVGGRSIAMGYPFFGAVKFMSGSSQRIVCEVTGGPYGPNDPSRGKQVIFNRIR